MDKCNNCGEGLRAGEAGVCKSCRQTQQEKAHVQALAATRAAELAPPPSPKTITPAKKEAASRTFRQPSA